MFYRTDYTQETTVATSIQQDDEEDGYKFPCPHTLMKGGGGGGGQHPRCQTRSFLHWCFLRRFVTHCEARNTHKAIQILALPLPHCYHSDSPDWNVGRCLPSTISNRFTRWWWNMRCKSIGIPRTACNWYKAILMSHVTAPLAVCPTMWRNTRGHTDVPRNSSTGCPTMWRNTRGHTDVPHNCSFTGRLSHKAREYKGPYWCPT